MIFKSANLYPNAHTHRNPANHEAAVVNLHRDENSIASTGLYSVGIHPWFISIDTIGEELDKLNLFLSHPNVVAVGECGLDKLSKVPWNLQCEIFEKQIVIAKLHNKPMIIHAVRAGGDILYFRKKFGDEPPPWLIHGFHGSMREAELYIMQGCYIGFGKHLFNPKVKSADVCKAIPSERILPETDDSTIEIVNVTEKIASLKGGNEDKMREILMENFINFFKLS